MCDVRLIALDLDGTLLDDDKGIHPDNITALREATCRGVPVAISSGRMIPRIEPVQDRLGFDCVLLAYNGAKVVGTRAEGRPLIRHRPVPADVADFFLSYSRRHDILLNFFHDDRLYAEASPARERFAELYSRRTGAEYRFGCLDEMAGTKPTKLILLCDPPQCERLRDRFRVELAGRAHVAISEPEYLEITDAGVNKGEALASIAAHHGCSVEQVMALGDAENDALMLEVAGLAVAVANARSSVKEMADFVTEKTNNEGGVAEAVRRFVLE